jgi:hypothetical protein
MATSEHISRLRGHFTQQNEFLEVLNYILKTYV